MMDRKDASCVGKKSATVRRAGLAVLIFATLSVPARAQTETVLYTFGSTPTDGYEPAAPLLIDSSGNLFGTTSAGGTAVLCPDPSGLNPCGTVFELVNSSGNYTEKVLYNFAGLPSDGFEPLAGLIADSAGNLYGTTAYGGSNFCGATTCGTVFELVKSSNGYTEKVLYMFTGYGGGFVFSTLVIDSAGNLYGTTNGGGVNGYGTVFELVNSSGSYTEKTLHNFGASATDGESPLAGLIMDAAGNLFGTTGGGGDALVCGLGSCGTVFELANSPAGYTEQILYEFTGSDGAGPVASLIMDASGNLYGTTAYGGAYGFGTAFELIRSSGSYTETVLHSFGGTSSDGVMPVASLLMDAAGNLYGTTKMGGSATACGGYGCGTVFELVNSSGSYTEKLLHSFAGVGDGETPVAALVMDGAGNLYSTTEVGGNFLSVGMVFEINPTAPAPTVMLSTSGLTFQEIVNGTSAAQTIIVTNSGIGNLVFGASGVTLSATNPLEFAVSADNCSGETIPPKATCSASVTFDPTVPGSATAVLIFSDNAVVSAQQVSLSGVGLTPNASVTLSPAVLNFSPQTVLTSSAPQTVTLMDSGATPLSITSISASPGFKETNNCGTSVAGGATCAIQVSFSPTAGGFQSGSLLVADSAGGSPQSAVLIGQGADFTISPAPGANAAVTISPGATATYAMVIAPQAGFNQAVTLACAGAPALASCSVSTGTAKLDGVDAVPLMVSVTTTAPALVVPQRTNYRIAPPSRLPALLLAALIDLIALLTVRLAMRRGMACVGRTGVSAVLLLTAAFWTCSCGGGASNPGSPGAPSGTPAGTYTLTVTGTAGAVQNATTLTLTVK
jgi:uncharacterized repeat protein (TIGR03803 family)